MSDSPHPISANGSDPVDRSPGTAGSQSADAQHEARGPEPHSTEARGPEPRSTQARSTETRSPSPDPASTELISVLLSTPDVEGFLAQTATIAANSTATSTSCGITLHRDGHPLTVGSSDDLAGSVDEAQYADEQGPCLLALQTGAIVSAPDLASDTRWPAYTARALTYGIASSLSLPLLVDDVSVGAMNLYSPAPGTFEEPAVMGHARSLAAQASVTLAVVLRQTRQTDLTESLRATLASRSVIDQAIGLLMGQQRCDAAAAFALLRAASQHRNRKLRDVAADVIAAAASRPGPRT